MKAFRQSEFLSRLVWLASICVVLMGLSALFYLFPELPLVSRVSRPFAPQVRYLAAGSYEHGSHGDSAELSAVWSPALISLPTGVISPEFGKNHITWVRPPLQASYGRALFLERAIPGEREHAWRLTEGRAGRARRSVALRSSKLAGSRVFDRSRLPEKRDVQVAALSGGLKDRAIDYSCLSLDKWAQPGGSWIVTLYVRFDDAGQPTEVFLESPARDKTLNEAAVRRMYQCRLTEPGDPCEGRITLSFLGNGPGTGPVNGKTKTQGGI
ncbi:hypothetical protein ACFLQR_01950 [Verrucomicrobiota bacterium]